MASSILECSQKEKRKKERERISTNFGFLELICNVTEVFQYDVTLVSKHL